MLTTSSAQASVDWPTILILLWIGGLFALLMFIVLRRIFGRGIGARDRLSSRLAMVMAWGVLLLTFFIWLAFDWFDVRLIGVLIIGAGVATTCAVQYSRGRINALLTLLATAANRGLPLDAVLETFGSDGLGWGSSRAADMAAWLKQGVSLPDALARTGERLGESAGVMLRMGQQTGDLRAALASLAYDRQKYRPIWRATVSQLCYLVTILCMALLYMSFVMFRIVPSLQYIFLDYKIPLPLLTQLVLSALQIVNEYAFLILPLFVLLLAYGFARYILDVRIDLPIVRQLVMPYHTANLLQALSLVAQCGQPFEPAILSLAKTYPRRFFIRRRLQRATSRMERGEDWLDSLRDERLIRSQEAAVLRASQRVGNLPWALREMADSTLRRFVLRLQTSSNLLFPLLLIAIGTAVGLYVVGMFLPLPVLIRSLT